MLYVEHKTTRQLAERLLAQVRQYGEKGFNLDDPDRGNDALRKATLDATDPRPHNLPLTQPLLLAEGRLGLRNLRPLSIGLSRQEYEVLVVNPGLARVACARRRPGGAVVGAEAVRGNLER